MLKDAKAVKAIREIELDLFIGLFAGSGIMVLVLMGSIASVGMHVIPVLRQESWERRIRPHRMRTLISRLSQANRGFSKNCSSDLSSYSQGTGWEVEEFIRVHKLVRASGKHNFESCRIPIPTAIRHDRIREALGDEATPKEERTLSLLEYGFPINCDASYGVKKAQKNHYSAKSFEKDVNDYLVKNVHSKSILGPFDASPIQDLCYTL